MTEYWLAIAPIDVCEAARRENFCQFGRGHMAPAVRMSLGDGVVLMGRPRGSVGAAETLYAIGTVDDGDAYAVPEQGREIWRRDVRWWPVEPASLRGDQGLGEPQPSLSTVRGAARLSAAEFLRLADILSISWDAPFIVEARSMAEAEPPPEPRAVRAPPRRLRR